jgi:hypothetical protein
MGDNIKYYPLSHTRNILQLVLINNRLETAIEYLHQIQEILESGEDTNYQLEKINTVILGWIQEKEKYHNKNGRFNEPPI